MAAVYLSHLEAILPPFYVPQERALEWLVAQHKRHGKGEDVASLERLFRRYGVKPEQIAGRYTACADMVSLAKEDHELLLFSKKNVCDIYPKTLFCREYFYDVLRAFYPEKSFLPSHLLHVTCTGYLAPSAPQLLVAALQAEVNISHAYHMGCYAALPAIRLAQGLAREAEGTRVEVVHTEACSLHMDPTDHSPEALVVQTLFADGNIKYRLSTTAEQPCFAVLQVQEQLIPNSAADMRWELRHWGFAMTLSRDVPLKITAALPAFLERFAARCGFAYASLCQEALFAIHPGGPRIIAAVSQELGLQEWQISASKKILREHGNMSSATLPHVWREIAQQDPEPGALVVSLAFGPGLTIFGALFRWQRGGSG